MSTVSEIKKTFREQGLTPKKWMGQNLLVGKQYLGKIVQAAQLEPGESIVEVGAGFGVLTEALLEKGAKVVALEVDSGFFRVLEDKFSGSPDVELIHADALKFDFRALSQRIGKLRVVANLPYNISSRLLFMFQENRDAFSSLHILLQREVAERFVAKPGTKDYGVLTVLLGVTAEVKILFHIPGKAFFPAPEVMSSFLSVSFPDPPPVTVSDPRLLTTLVKASFTGRRKTLRNTLRNATMFGISNEGLIQAAQETNIDLARRGETLSPAEFARFADAIVFERSKAHGYRS
ncbi:MAG: ribosomal RNA small subunit methyltransferase A [Desulfomonile tiedjei]|uniref:Ribosomal RNA small subunit methyltransferase A n=1 Tax=Desulfomonile tiedjei TaxID=2358 RepID=A0A9D6Z0M7_9BACT|nr:ribosomal RNA small subunit methyltransferase A [Desulfomonile tiedjei]